MHTTTQPKTFCSEARNRTTSYLLAYVTGVQGGGRGEMRNAKRKTRNAKSEARNAKRDPRKTEGNACMQAGNCFLPSHCDRASLFYFFLLLFLFERRPHRLPLFQNLKVVKINFLNWYWARVWSYCICVFWVNQHGFKFFIKKFLLNKPKRR